MKQEKELLAEWIAQGENDKRKVIARRKRVAEQLEITDNYLTMILSGRREINPKLRWKFQQAYGMRTYRKVFENGNNHDQHANTRQPASNGPAA